MKSINTIENVPQKSLVERYIWGLREAYLERGGKEEWDIFEKVVEGACEENLRRIKDLYPEVPASLIELLSYVDGTYYSTDSFIENIFADNPFDLMKLLYHNDYMDRSRMVEQCKMSKVDFPVMKTIDYMNRTIIVYEVIWERNMICYDADGEVVWRVHGSNIGSLLIRSAKLTDDNKIIVHDILNDTFIVDPETGLATRDLSYG